MDNRGILSSASPVKTAEHGWFDPDLTRRAMIPPVALPSLIAYHGAFYLLRRYRKDRETPPLPAPLTEDISQH